MAVGLLGVWVFRFVARSSRSDEKSGNTIVVERERKIEREANSER